MSAGQRVSQHRCAREPGPRDRVIYRRVPLAAGPWSSCVGEDSTLTPSLFTLSDVFPTGHHAAVKGGVNPRPMTEKTGEQQDGKRILGNGLEVSAIGLGCMGMSSSFPPFPD